MEKENLFLVDGGIGDILLSYEGINRLLEIYKEDELHCILLSHFADAKTLLKPFNFRKSFHYYEDNNELINLYQTEIEGLSSLEIWLGRADVFGKSLFPKIDIPNDAKYESDQILMDFSKRNEHISNGFNLIGIHPFGSKFANKFLTEQRKVPSKNMPIEFSIELIKTLDNTLQPTIFSIFGSKAEKEYYDILIYNLEKQLPNIKNRIISSFENDIWTSFALVESCNIVIAADSAIKSFSLIKKIPTIVTLGDYIDGPRDSIFIDPYVAEKILTPVYFKDSLKEEHLRKIIDETTKVLLPKCIT